jgi:hypothetical protein
LVDWLIADAYGQFAAQQAELLELKGLKGKVDELTALKASLETRFTRQKATQDVMRRRVLAMMCQGGLQRAWHAWRGYMLQTQVRECMAEMQELHALLFDCFGC